MAIGLGLLEKAIIGSVLNCEKSLGRGILKMDTLCLQLMPVECGEKRMQPYRIPMENKPACLLALELSRNLLLA